MKLIRTHPITKFVKIASNKNGNQLLICSPYFSAYGLKLMSDLVRTRKIKKVQLLVNVGGINPLLAHNNPKDVLVKFRRDCIDSGVPHQAFTMKSNGLLHAKLYLLPDELGLAGSSNITNGGDSHLELNYLIGNSRKSSEQEHLKELKRWFAYTWNSSATISKYQLKKIDEKYRKAEEIRLNLSKTMSHYIIPNLGGDNWEKVREICRSRSRPWEENELELKLGGNKSRVTAKLQFLIELGLLTELEGRTTTYDVNRGIWQDIKSKKDFATLLINHPGMPYFRKLLVSLRSFQAGRPYSDLANRQHLRSEINLHAAVRWFEDLNLIKREQNKKKYGNRNHHFILKKSAETLFD